MDIEELIINLKVIGSIEVNQKVITRGKYLNIEPISIIPEAVRRWWRQDNRYETIKKVNEIVDIAIRESIKQKNMKPDNVNEDYTVSFLTISDYLPGVIGGLKNLKQTYSTCIITSCQIDSVIDKINKYDLTMGNNLFKNIKNVDSEQIQNDESKNNKKNKNKI